jgi:hypothetical protein
MQVRYPSRSLLQSPTHYSMRSSKADLSSPFRTSAIPFVHCHICNMRFSDMVLLKTGVFQLERGHGQWNPDQCETVVILFAGSETELTPRRFEEDQEVL